MINQGVNLIGYFFYFYLTKNSNINSWKRRKKKLKINKLSFQPVRKNETKNSKEFEFEDLIYLKINMFIDI